MTLSSSPTVNRVEYRRAGYFKDFGNLPHTTHTLGQILVVRLYSDIPISFHELKLGERFLRRHVFNIHLPKTFVKHLVHFLFRALVSL